MAFALDFHRPQRPLFRGPLWLRLVVFAASTGLVALAVEDVSTRYSHREQWQQRLASLRQNLGQKRDNKAEATPSENRALAQFAAPWESLFGAVERHRTEEIALIGMSAEQGSRELVLKGEARNIEALKILVEGLAQEEVFDQVLPASHKPLDGGGAAVSFEVRARWR